MLTSSTHGNRTEYGTKGFVLVLKRKTDDDIYAFPCALPAVDELEPQDPARPDDQAEEHQSKNEKLKTEASSPEHMLLHRPKDPYVLLGLWSLEDDSKAGSQDES